MAQKAGYIQSAMGGHDVETSSDTVGDRLRHHFGWSRASRRRKLAGDGSFWQWTGAPSKDACLSGARGASSTLAAAVLFHFRQHRISGPRLHRRTDRRGGSPEPEV